MFSQVEQGNGDARGNKPQNACVAREQVVDHHGLMGSSADDESPTDPLALPVGTVARLLGTAASTLRTWDRRYGLGPSGRIGGSHRRYTPEDVARLTLMRSLLGRGAGPAEAARVAAGTARDQLPAVPVGPGAGRLPGSGRAGTADAAVGVAEDLDVATEQTIDALAAEFAMAALEYTPLSRLPRAPAALPDTSAAAVAAAGSPVDRVPAQLRRIARAVVLIDSPAITELVFDSTSRRGVVASWDSLIAPVLRGLGRQWAQLGSGIELEHVFSETVLAVLRHRMVELGGNPENPTPAVLACGPEEIHSMPLHAVAAALAERRVGARVLGARVPVAALVAAVRRSQTSVTFVWSQTPATAVLDLDALKAARPGLRVVVGGPGWNPQTLDPEVMYVDDFGRAVDTVAALAG
jgi:DNA-binding transcriptional MerR regulator